MGSPNSSSSTFKTLGGNLKFRMILIGLANLNECARKVLIVDDPSTKTKRGFPVYIGLSVTRMSCRPTKIQQHTRTKSNNNFLAPEQHASHKTRQVPK